MRHKDSFLFAPLCLALGGIAVGAGSFGHRFSDGASTPPDLSAAEQAVFEALDAPLVSHFSQSGVHRLWIEKDIQQTLARLSAAGTLLRAYDYGAFAVAMVDEGMHQSAAAFRAAGLVLADDQDFVYFNEFHLDGRAPAGILAALPSDLRMGTPGASGLTTAAGLYVVQFEGPVREEWSAAIDSLGATFRQFLPNNAYVIQLPPERVGELSNLAAASPWIQYAGVYEPAFRVHAELRAALASYDNSPRKVTIQLVDGPDVRAALTEIEQVADQVLDSQNVGPYLNIQAVLHPMYLPALASSPHVFQIEPRYEIVKHDERQGQIVGGNVTATGPSAPGYLAYLAGLGFDATQFTGFSVNVVDDAMSLTGHPDLPTARVAFALNPTGQTGTEAGHGFLNAHIIGGINTGTGTAVEDTGGYNYGLGIAPWARVGSTAIFGAGALNPTTYESQAYGLGSRISSNSWGFQTFSGGPVPDYDASSQQYDFIARDAQTGTAGHQQYTVVFSAGNSGSGSNTVSTPGTAKNIVTVAAGENDRQTGSDGCGITNTGANNWNDIATFSSRGPVNATGGDGRWKPEISAPGTHIQAGVPQSNYDGSGICNAFWPTGQTLYGWSSGTSHSCPAVAGGAALVYQWFLNQGLGAPSPAMVKAALVGGTTYMTGTGAAGNLPSNSQGTGNMNLTRSAGSTARLLVDQTQVLGASGATYTLTGNIASSTEPFRVALVWTDAPGPTSGAPYVNNLNLTVTVGGNTYLGNVFSGANSITGGTADIRNNTEVVFLPAGTSGPFTITVTAAAIGGDGVPGNADTTDQDFALWAFNATAGAPVAPTANFTGTPTSGSAPLLVNFSDSSTGTITGWSWTFGDGGTSTAQNPSYTYTATGTYTVSLTVSGPGGNNTLTRTNYISVGTAAPTANFTGTPTSGTTPLVVNFTDSSTGAISGWSWNFGDGGTSTAQNPSHTYTTAGTYTVSLTVSGPGGNNTQTRANYVTASNPGSSAGFYMSFAANTTVPGLGTVADEDIVFYDTTTSTWSLYFDGSDVGLSGTNLNGFHVRANGAILMTFDSATFTVTGLTGGPAGTTVEDSDVILFTPTSTGATTAGSFSFYFDGSDVGLTTNNEDIDDVFEFPDGSLGMTFLGTFSVTGASGEDEDVLRFTGSYGSATSGTWAWFFDGSDVGFSTTTNEDLDGITSADGTSLQFSTLGAFSVTGAAGDGIDIGTFTGTFGTATSGSSALTLDLSTIGIATTANVDALSIKL